MTPFFKHVFTTLNDHQLPYIVGAESLVGLSEGDLFKYSHNLRLYLYPLNKRQLFRLAWSLLKHRIILKPKDNRAHRYYKLRFKPTLFTKASMHVNMTLLTPTENGYTAFVGGHDTQFAAEDLQQTALQTMEVEGHKIALPPPTGNFC